MSSLCSPLKNFNAVSCGTIFTPPRDPKHVREPVGYSEKKRTTVGLGCKGCDRLVLCDFDDAKAVESATAFALGTGPYLFVVADLLCLLEDPRILLRRLRQILKAKEGSEILFSTSPEQPKNALRFWDVQRLSVFLEESGFVVAKGNDDNLIFASCTPKSYEAFLTAKNLAPSSPFLFVTTETTLHKSYGGIASYLQSVWKVFPRKPIIYTTFPLPPDRIKSNQLPSEDFPSYVLDRTDFLTEKGVHDVYADDLTASVLDDLRQVLFIYDDIKLIEIQDYIADAARLSQARDAGLIAPSLTILCRGHGSHIYLERANEVWFDALAYEKFMLNERLAIETADHFLPASDYLRRLYVLNGVQLPAATQALPLPYLLQDIKENEKENAISPTSPDTLIFYGKPIPAKGFPDFVTALLDLAKQKDFSTRIKKIIILGGDIPLDFQDAFRKLPDTIPCEAGFKSYAETQKTLRDLGPRALVVMPYRADNWPMSVLEALDANTNPIAYATGGIPEIIGTDGADLCLCENNSQALAQHILKLLRKPPETLAAKRETFQNKWRARQNQINQDLPDFYEKLSLQTRNDDKISGAQGGATFVVSLIDATWSWLNALQIAMKSQIHAPDCILFVAPENSPFIRIFEHNQTDRFRLLIVPHNASLATARRKGLEACSTSFVAFFESGYLPLPRFLHEAICSFSVDKICCAAFGFSRQILEGNDLPTAVAGTAVAPLGIIGLLTHRPHAFGPSCALFRAEDIRKTDFSREDLADLYLFLTRRGGKISVTPHVNLAQEFSVKEKENKNFVQDYALLSSFAAPRVWEDSRALALALTSPDRAKHVLSQEHIVVHPSSLEALYEALGEPRMRGKESSPELSLWPRQGEKGEDIIWNDAPAYKIILDTHPSQAETLHLSFTFNTLPTAWGALFQHGDTVKNYRIKILFNPSGDLWIEFGAAQSERPITGFEIPRLICVGKKVDLQISVLAKAGAILISANGERVVSEIRMPWTFPDSNVFWIGSRRYHGAIHTATFCPDFLAHHKPAQAPR